MLATKVVPFCGENEHRGKRCSLCYKDTFSMCLKRTPNVRQMLCNIGLWAMVADVDNVYVSVQHASTYGQVMGKYVPLTSAHVLEHILATTEQQEWYANCSSRLMPYAP